MTRLQLLVAAVVTLGAAMASPIFLHNSVQPAKAAGFIRIIVGLNTYEATITPNGATCTATGTSAYWHCDEGNRPQNVGLDLTNTVGSTAIATSFQSHGSSGYAYGYVENHYVAGVSYCPGRDIAIWIPYPSAAVGSWVGYVDYVQISPSATVGSTFYIGTGWTFAGMGTVHGSAPGGGCPWAGAHLHQSTSSGFYMGHNPSLISDDDPSWSGMQIYTTGSVSDNFFTWISY
jgi:hypothetical protein